MWSGFREWLGKDFGDSPLAEFLKGKRRRNVIVMENMMSDITSGIIEHIVVGAHPTRTGSNIIMEHPENTIEAIVPGTTLERPGARREVTARATIAIVKEEWDIPDTSTETTAEKISDNEHIFTTLFSFFSGKVSNDLMKERIASRFVHHKIIERPSHIWRWRGASFDIFLFL